MRLTRNRRRIADDKRQAELYGGERGGGEREARDAEKEREGTREMHARERGDGGETDCAACEPAL